MTIFFTQINKTTITSVPQVNLNLPRMLKQKEDAVSGLTKGVAGLFKKYKVRFLVLSLN